jgi:LuxR family maltose regulon positive regulatory protein
MTIMEDAPSAEWGANWASGPLAPGSGREGMPVFVARPHLLSRLDARPAPLTVVSAPAGWGKTTLLSAWIHHHRGRAVRVAPGSRAGFWHRMMTAVAAATPVLSEAIETLDATDGPARLAGVLSRAPSPLAVVVDDCNDVAGPDALADLAQVVRATGGLIRLVLACRGAPALALHRWRMDGELFGLSEDGLAFSIEETAALLAGHGVTLPRRAVADLHGRTEGWAAGLRLAAVSLQQHAEPAQALLDAGATELIAEYLRAEVLARLDAWVHRVLVQTSVAERLTADLVNALTARTDGAAVLADLRRQGAFIRRCPGPGDWYRLHPMLSRVLYQELSGHDDDRVVRAHRRAADWYLVQGPPAEALRHLLAAREWQRAAGVLSRHWPDVVVSSRRLNVRRVVTAVPGAPAPQVVLAMAAERLDAGDTTASRHLLQLAGPDPDPAVSSIRTALHLAIARLDGHLQQVCARACEALTEPPSGARPAGSLQPLVLLSLGATKLHLGQLPEAGRCLQQARALARQHDLHHVEISAASLLAAWYAALGRLHDAVRTAGEALDSGHRLGLAQSTDLGWSRLALAEAYLQWDRLEDAWRCADTTLDSSGGDRLVQLTATIVHARLRLATGQLADAYDTLRTADHESVTADLPAPARRSLSLVDAELHLACGDPVAAHERLRSWPEPDPLPAHAAVIEGAILLCQGQPSAAGVAVAPYLRSDDVGTSLTCRAGAGLVAALAGDALGRRDQVVRGLEAALQVADEQGHRRCFSAGGHPVRALIESVAPTMPAYPPVAAVLTATLGPTASDAAGLQRVPLPSAGRAPAAGLVEPLTSRELTVLRYLQGTLSHGEIAALMYISVNTVKTHVKSIYRKLGAGCRRDAVCQGRELRLL